MCGGDRHNLNGGSAYFNIAETILVERMCADQNRDDDEAIGRVDVAYPSEGPREMIAGLVGDAPAWTNRFNGEIYLPEPNETNGWRDLGFQDETILHEYAYHLTEEVSENDWALHSHAACTLIDGEFAWFEGFAEYMSAFLTNKYREIASQ